jgi:hypothetical protein
MQKECDAVGYNVRTMQKKRKKASKGHETIPLILSNILLTGQHPEQ